ncbi:hypothetical protein [Ruminococcus sp.]|uniref:hypothetical protein n=1 Tax=Ruminococcus sp. TaxID=41978 RepID=UPI0025FC5152|nr:hypothetical protein [Ruminococcus sp.]MBQ8967701.1 hypothetical protein [Ruminococcus sp.]
MTDEGKKQLKTVLMGSGKQESIFLWLLLGSRRGIDMVKRRSDSLHRVVFVLEICLFFFGLVRLLTVYGGLPAQTGIHFKGEAYIIEDMSFSETIHTILHGYQPIDVTGSKIMLFYPFVISAAALLFDIIIPKIAGRLAKRRSSDNAEVSVRIWAALQTALDISAFSAVLYFSILWNEYMIRQLPMRMLFTHSYGFLIVLSLADMVFFTVSVNKKYGKREEKK